MSPERFAMFPGPSLITLAILTCLALPAIVHSDDPPPKAEEERAEVASPSREQLAQITKTARRIVPSLFRVGRPGGSGGTAFLISREHRLLATAGHIADYFYSGEGRMLAIPDGTATPYRIERVYFHPGYVRELDMGLWARSDDPEDGPIDHLRGPDIAVLCLAEGGPDLPDDLILASVEELRALDGHALGMFGYPAELTDGWPTERRPAWAILASGLLQSSVEDKPFGLSFPRPQRFWVSSNLKSGASGGLVFLDNGHVAGIISGATWNGYGTWSTRCTRVDSLLELLQHYRLGGDELDPVVSKVQLGDWKNDLRLPQLREAVRKIGEANEHRRNGEYQIAGRLCNEVIAAFPEYGNAYLERGWGYSDYLDAEWNRLTPEERIRYAEWACNDSERCTNIFPEPGLFYLVHAQNHLQYGRATSDQEYFRSVAANMNVAINNWSRYKYYQPAFAHHIRARAHHYLGNADAAGSDFAEAIRLDPEETRWLLGRAKFYEERGKPDLAAKDRRKAEELQAPKVNPFDSPVIPLLNNGRSPFELDPRPRS
jgi:hypothetical protein